MAKNNMNKKTDNKHYPIIVSLSNKCLIWDEIKQDWQIKQKQQDGNWIIVEEKDKIVIELKSYCCCGGSLWLRQYENPSEIEIIRQNNSINLFKKQHEKCGKKRSRIINEETHYKIKEEEER